MSIITRNTLQAMLIILAAILADSYLSKLHQFWVPLITMILLFTQMKPNLQSLLQGFVIVSLGLCAAYLLTRINLAAPMVAVIVYVILVLAFMLQQLTSLCFILYVIPGLLYIFLHFYWPSVPLYDLFYDTVLAASLCVLGTLLIFPARADVDFRKGLIPVFEAYRDYLKNIMQYLFDKKTYEAISFEKKFKTMRVLLEEDSFFPEWVYQFNFDAFFRQGHRHFLIRTEQVGAVLFAMHQTARYETNQTLLASFQENFTNGAQAIDELFEAIITRLKLANVELSPETLQNEIASLDSALAKETPVSVELFDVSEDYLRLAGLVYEFKNLQKLLIKLVEALR